MMISPALLAETLFQMHSEGMSDKDLVFSLSLFLKRKKKEYLFPDVITSLESILNNKEKKLDVLITSASLLSEDAKEVVFKKAQSLFPAMNIISSYKEDKNIIGGVIISTAESTFDASVRSTLQELKKSL